MTLEATGSEPTGEAAGGPPPEAATSPEKEAALAELAQLKARLRE